MGARGGKRLLTCGAAAGPLFVAVAMVDGATRPGYSAMRHPLSTLALGRAGWRQSANFVLAGGLYMAGSVGLLRSPRPPWRIRSAPLFVAAAAVGLIGSGVFVTDPVNGYPPESADGPTEPTVKGARHNMCSVPIFLWIPLATFLSAWSGWRAGRRGWALVSAASGIAMLSAVRRAAAGFNQDPRLVHYGGLFQRLSVTAGFGWLTALFLRSLRR